MIFGIQASIKNHYIINFSYLIQDCTEELYKPNTILRKSDIPILLYCG